MTDYFSQSRTGRSLGPFSPLKNRPPGSGCINRQLLASLRSHTPDTNIPVIVARTIGIALLLICAMSQKSGLAGGAHEEPERKLEQVLAVCSCVACSEPTYHCPLATVLGPWLYTCETSRLEKRLLPERRHSCAKWSAWLVSHAWHLESSISKCDGNGWRSAPLYDRAEYMDP